MPRQTDEEDEEGEEDQANRCLDNPHMMVWCDGMPTMTHRTTFALDEATAQRLKRLAARWNVSQAEVVRRSVEQAELTREASNPDPISLLKQLHAQGGGIDKAQADQWIKEIHEDRKRWRASS
jgi:predicted transcriptional regulator